MSNTIIATNVMALNSHRALTGVGGKLSKSSEKLSTGFRINRAADDAAGLAISEKMRSQIRGLDQATRNSQDGISLIQTAEGALQETENMLQKMRELTVQAANDTNTASDRDKIAGEIDEIIAEIDATAEKTEFNTKKLIDGSWKNESIYLQTGANSSQGMAFNIEQMDAMTLGTTPGTISSVIRGNGVDAESAIAAITADNSGTARAITDKELTGVFTFADGASLEIKENGDIEVTGMTVGGAEAEKSYTAADAKGKTFADADGNTIGIAPDGKVTITGITTGTAFAAPTVASGATTSVKIGTVDVDIKNKNASDPYADATDADLEYTFKDLTGVTFMKADGTEVTDEIKAGEAISGTDLQAALGAGGFMIDKDGNKYDFGTTDAGKFEADAPEQSIGFIATNDETKAIVEDLAVTGQASGKVISSLTETIDAAIETVSSQRAKLGAYQNRLDYTINNLQTSSENLAASESRIRDTDMAKEMMNLTKSNVLQQAATSMLAQANQAPQNILKLLG